MQTAWDPRANLDRKAQQKQHSYPEPHSLPIAAATAPHVAPKSLSGSQEAELQELEQGSTSPELVVAAVAEAEQVGSRELLTQVLEGNSGEEDGCVSHRWEKGPLGIQIVAVGPDNSAQEGQTNCHMREH